MTGGRGSIARSAGLTTAVVLTAALAGGCSGGSDNENEIRPVVADISIADTTGTDPAIYLERASAVGDLVTVNVMLRAGAPVSFNAYTLELQIDPGLVQVASVSYPPSGLFMACTPDTLDNASQFNALGATTLIIGVGTSGLTCSGYTTTGAPEILATLGLRAATTGSSTLHFIDAAGHGDCELLDSALMDLGIPCVDGAPPPTLTATR